MALALGPAARLDQAGWVTSILQGSDFFSDEKVGEKFCELVFVRKLLQTTPKASSAKENKPGKRMPSMPC